MTTRGNVIRRWLGAAAAVALLGVPLASGSAAEPPGATGVGATSFPDVPADHPFVAEITWAAETGLVHGYSDGTYGPTRALTRQTYAALLHRWLAPDLPDDEAPDTHADELPPEPTFSDVPLDHPFIVEIEAMAALGVIAGHPDGTFRPTAPITRQTGAALLGRVAAIVDGHEPPVAPIGPFSDPVPDTAAFPDVPRDHPFLAEIHTAFGLGLVGGYDDRTFRPASVITRQSAAALLFRLDGWAHPAYEPVWEENPCATPTPAGRTTVCGTLTVPEDRDDPDGAKVSLAVAVVKTNSLVPAPDAGVYLGGGPGGTVMDSLPGRYKSAYGLDRDFVMFDQRGVGLSEPNLDCPERDEALWDAYGTADPYATELIPLVEATEACRERLVAAGVDLTSYTTIDNALDVRDLRRALGYDEWNLYGVSYGTSLAQQAARVDPFGTRTVVYDSVLPNLDLGPERLAGAADRVFGHLWAGCAADTSCAAAHPDLGAEFAAVTADYDADPMPLTIPDPGGGADRDLLLTGADLAGGLFSALYRTDIIPALPGVISAAASRDEALLTLIATEGLAGLTELVDGVFLSMECHDRPGGGRAEVEALLLDRPDLGALFTTAAFSYCETWDVPPAPWTFQTLPVSSVPSLVLAGSYDPITPPEGGQALHAALLRSTYAEFPRYGHGILSSANTCATAITRALLTAPDEPPDTSCLAAEGPPDFP